MIFNSAASTYPSHSSPFLIPVSVSGAIVANYRRRFQYPNMTIKSAGLYDNWQLTDDHIVFRTVEFINFTINRKSVSN